MKEIIGIIFTLLTGAFFLLGVYLTFYFKNKKGLLDFVLGLAFVVALGLVITDLLPECNELFEDLNIIVRTFLMITFAVFGVLLIKIIDSFIPHHSHHKEIEEGKHENHLYHIGVVTTIALFLHNALEGLMIYTFTLTGIVHGLILALGVAAHNIPLGMHISASLDEGKYKKIWLALLTVSGVLGAVIVILLNNNIDAYILGSFMCIATGMLIYIAIFELLGELFHSDKKISLLGGFCGLILVLISLLINF